MPLSKLHIRILSGTILGLIVLTAVALGGWFFLIFVALAALLSVYEWSGLAKKREEYALHMAIGLVYLSICFFSFIYLRFEFDHGVWYALSLIICVAASDTGAYITGKIIRGPKMAPKISPKKTWAGLAGSMMFCGLAFLLCDIAMNLPLKPLWAVFLLGAFLGFVGQTGDLFISSFKRRAGLKDTGTLIPGHGGLLDRIDALLLVCPSFLFALMLWPQQ